MNATYSYQYGGANYGGYAAKAGLLAKSAPGNATPDLYVATCWPTLQALTGVQSPAVPPTPPIVFAGIFDMTTGRGGPATNPHYGAGNNSSGFISHGQNLVVQWLGILQTIAPNVNRVGVIYECNAPGNRPSPNLVLQAITAAAPHGVTVTPIPIPLPFTAASLAAFETSIKTFATVDGNGGLIVAAGTAAATIRTQIVGYAFKYALPAIYPNRMYVTSGGLISWGTNLTNQYLSAGKYAATILNKQIPIPRIDATQAGFGANPPVFEYGINLNTAAALGANIYANAKLIAAGANVGLVIGQ